jgi:hypothetical protein
MVLDFLRGADAWEAYRIRPHYQILQWVREVPEPWKPAINIKFFLRRFFATPWFSGFPNPRSSTMQTCRKFFMTGACGMKKAGL